MSNFLFKEEASESTSIDKVSKTKVWRILVIDDDDSVHQVTRLVLSDAIIENRTLDIVSVYSSKEARELLLQDDDFCMAFVDVVMETDDAGLNVVKYIRTDLGREDIRIVLRTGQPGYAPEEQVIKDYDINDYKTKTELTRSKLVTTIIASLRSYQQILSINQSRLGLQKIIVSAANLMEENSVKSFLATGRVDTISTGTLKLTLSLR